MKELLSKISITTFLLVYLFFCGTLYLISYWSTFDFDITNYIELLDIPKSFVFPLATGIGISLITILIQAVVQSVEKIEKDEARNEELIPRIKELPTKTLIFRIINDYNVWVITILFICLIFYRPHREWVFGLVSLALIIFSITTFIRHDAVIKFVPRFGLRLILAVFLFFIPIFSFMIGKLNAIEVWKNKNYFTIKAVIFKDITVQNRNIISAKLLGKLGSNLFLSDSLNTNIIVLNLDEVQVVEYKYIRKKE